MKVTYYGFKELIRGLHLKAGKIRHAQGQLRKIAEGEVEAAQLRIDQTKLDPEGRPWLSWSSATAEARAKDGTYDLGLLYHTGNMYKSFSVDINSNGDSIQMIIGNTAHYAPYIQEGTEKMPARPFLGWSTASQDNFSLVMNTYIKDIIEEGYV